MSKADERRIARMARLQDAIGYRFSDPATLERAFNHRSARGRSNERLEFLGDAVLDSVISEQLFHQFAEADEGVLSRLRASLVRDQSLAALATALELGELLKLGPGELKSGGSRRRSLLADALEAMFAAVFLDGGYPAADAVIRRVFGQRLLDLEEAAAEKDAKTRLQERLQAEGLSLPDYELIGSDGPPHQQTFTVRCRVSKPALEASGAGRSRRKAEQRAAAEILQLMESGT